MRILCRLSRDSAVLAGTSPPMMLGTCTISSPSAARKSVWSYWQPAATIWSSTPMARSARRLLAGWLMPTPETDSSGLISTTSTANPRSPNASAAPSPPAPAAGPRGVDPYPADREPAPPQRVPRAGPADARAHDQNLHDQASHATVH